MKDEILRVSWIDEQGKKHPWIVVGHYDDPKHPRRKYCYQEQNPATIWFDDAENLQDVMSYLWKNVINASVIAERGITIVIEKA